MSADRAMSAYRAISTDSLPKTWSYDRMMRLFGGLWFVLLALCVAIKMGASPADPWPLRLSSFCLAIFYMLLAAVDHDPGAGKGAGGGPAAENRCVRRHLFAMDNHLLRQNGPCVAEPRVDRFRADRHRS